MTVRRTTTVVTNSAASSSSSSDPWWLYVAIAGGGALVVMVVLYLACRPRRRVGSADLQSAHPSRAASPTLSADAPLVGTPRKAFDISSTPTLRSARLSDSAIVPHGHIHESSFIAAQPSGPSLRLADIPAHHQHHHAAAAPLQWSVDDDGTIAFILPTCD